MEELDDNAFMNAPPPHVEEKPDVVIEETSNDDEVSQEQAPVVEKQERESDRDDDDEVVENQPAPKEETPEPSIDLPNQRGIEDKPAGEKLEVKDPVKQDAIDYQGFYQEIMAPLKANGKDIEIRSKEDILQLMRMGANYTRKMQDIAPHRKILAMLENNGVLDESKLSYLIDLDKKNPEAIKKLVKDAGIDPMDIDTSKEPDYQQGNHRVGDDEVAFRSALEDIKSTPTGQTTLQVIDSTWDQASKEELWKSPEVLSIINQQRENGIYDRVTTEVQRQTTLGLIPPSTPFVQAYLQVGKELGAKGAFADIASTAQPTTSGATQQRPVQVNRPLATRVATPKAQVTNSVAANAASTSRGIPKRIAPVAHLMGASDEEFMKNWTNRV